MWHHVDLPNSEIEVGIDRVVVSNVGLGSALQSEDPSLSPTRKNFASFGESVRIHQCAVFSGPQDSLSSPDLTFFSACAKSVTHSFVFIIAVFVRPT
jgi:hypothetical protein